VEEEVNNLKLEFQNVHSSASQGMVAVTYLIGSILTSQLKSQNFGLEVNVKSHGLPIGAGLGSSAAFSVACAAACLQLHHKLLAVSFDYSTSDNLQWINRWAFLAEVLIHGTPSGLDNTTSTYGGIVKFIKMENNQNQIDNLVDVPKLQILLTNTKVPRSTKELVASVKNLYQSYPAVIQPIFQSIQEITNEFVDILEK
jgi:mevalonate kinase